MVEVLAVAKRVACVGAILVTAACGSTKSVQVAELTRQDKHMDCTQLQLELTEAEFFRDRAERNRGLNFKNVVMPLGYPSTYMSSEKAVDSASGRIEYLSRLSEIKRCDQQQYVAAPQPAMPEVVAYHAVQGQVYAVPQGQVVSQQAAAPQAVRSY